MIVQEHPAVTFDASVHEMPGERKRQQLAGEEKQKPLYS
jgi:hypothetical protein